MVLKAKTRIAKNKNSSTLYLTIPAELAKDSQFPFHEGEEVELQVKKEDWALIVTGESYIIKQSLDKFHENLKRQEQEAS
jgi:antitoxin component of MazEF toxin-antitoxin module